MVVWSGAVSGSECPGLGRAQAYLNAETNPSGQATPSMPSHTIMSPRF